MLRVIAIIGLVFMGAVLFGCGEQDVSRTPNIILLSIDTLRSDHLSCYGYDRPTSPWIDSVAAQGVRFEEVVSHSPSTAPSHMSIFTSTHPGVHGVHIRDEGVSFGRLPSGLISLPEVLKAVGYRTAAFTGGAQVTAGFGFERGFEVYKEDMFRLEEEDFVAVHEWLGTVGEGEPFFLFLHTYEVHAPYQPPPPFDTMYDPEYDGPISADWEEKEWFDKLMALRPLGEREVTHLRALYDGGIQYTDQTLGRFFEALAAKGLFGDEETLLIITSDHGEEFMEHGRLAHMQLYREVMHVPLIFHWPGVIPAGKELKNQVRLIDVVPTVFDYLGLPQLPQAQGKSLKPRIEAGDGQALPALSENHHRQGEQALRLEGWTYYARGNKGSELYARDDDADESNNLLDSEEEKTKYDSQSQSMIKAMDAFLLENDTHTKRLNLKDQSPTNSDHDKALEERLRTLGYLK